MRHWSIARNLAACLLAICAPGGALAQVTLTHVHGLAFSPDGKRLIIPSHHGLAVYENGRWSKAQGPQHDYMGFAATAKHLYSSGHPAPGSGLVNPLGLIRSKDGARSWDKLGLEGETDFHLLATSWNTDAIYVWNPAPSSRMKQAGLHYTLNDGFAWKHAAAARLEGKQHAVAVHPDDPANVAVATSKGIYLSRDSGERFAALVAGTEGLAVFFDLDGKHLWYAAFNGQAHLARVPLRGAGTTAAALPALVRDAVSYIAQNPASRKQYAIATINRSVFLSSDEGRNWKQIARDGGTM